MANINNRNPGGLWPWGGNTAGGLRERKVTPEALRPKKLAKKGDPRNPALASAALLDFIGPGHTSDELRLPLPPHPRGHDADLEGFNDRPHLAQVAERGEPASLERTKQLLSELEVAADRRSRLEGLLEREERMLGIIGRVSKDQQEVDRLRREEQKEEPA
jgi:hypothetical protein